MASANKVLVVDDDPSLLLLISSLLQDAGYEVLRAEDVDTAKRLIAEHIPNLIITDIVMPKKGGYDLIQELKDEGYAGKLVVASGDHPYNLKKMLETATLMGVDAVIEKPIEEVQLLKTVSGLLPLK